MFEPARRLFLAFVLTFATIVATDFTIAGVADAQPRFASTEGRYAAIVLDAGTGEVLFERNADAARYPASDVSTTLRRSGSGRNAAGSDSYVRRPITTVCPIVRSLKRDMSSGSRHGMLPARPITPEAD